MTAIHRGTVTFIEPLLARVILHVVENPSVRDPVLEESHQPRLPVRLRDVDAPRGMGFLDVNERDLPHPASS